MPGRRVAHLRWNLKHGGLLENCYAWARLSDPLFFLVPRILNLLGLPPIVQGGRIISFSLQNRQTRVIKLGSEF